MKGVTGDLAARDAVVLELLLRGVANKAIGKEIGISPSLVSYSIRRIFAARCVHNLVELGAYAERHGLMPERA